MAHGKTWLSSTQGKIAVAIGIAAIILAGAMTTGADFSPRPTMSRQVSMAYEAQFLLYDEQGQPITADGVAYTEDVPLPQSLGWRDFALFDHALCQLASAALCTYAGYEYVDGSGGRQSSSQPTYTTAGSGPTNCVRDPGMSLTATVIGPHRGYPSSPPAQLNFLLRVPSALLGSYWTSGAPPTLKVVKNGDVSGAPMIGTQRVGEEDVGGRKVTVFRGESLAAFVSWNAANSYQAEFPAQTSQGSGRTWWWCSFVSNAVRVENLAWTPSTAPVNNAPASSPSGQACSGAACSSAPPPPTTTGTETGGGIKSRAQPLTPAVAIPFVSIRGQNVDGALTVNATFEAFLPGGRALEVLSSRGRTVEGAGGNITDLGGKWTAVPAGDLISPDGNSGFRVRTTISVEGRDLSGKPIREVQESTATYILNGNGGVQVRWGNPSVSGVGADVSGAVLNYQYGGAWRKTVEFAAVPQVQG